MGNVDPPLVGACGARRRMIKLAVTATNKTAPTMIKRVICLHPVREDAEVKALLPCQRGRYLSTTVAGRQPAQWTESLFQTAATLPEQR
jgi:hypothetical protein